MVQLLLSRSRACRLTVLLISVALLSNVSLGLGRSAKPVSVPAPADLLLDGGRKLSFVRSFSSELETRGKRGIWSKVLDVIAGEPEYHRLVRPSGIAVDSHGRIIVTDPGAQGIHIFDFENHKYKFIERIDKSKDAMKSPQCVAVDADDNIYVTDSENGVIFEFGANGKFLRTIGSLRGGEGYFKRPTGIAVDSKAGRIYVTDTQRDQVFVLDMKGVVLSTIGKHGIAPGELFFPTELNLTQQGLLVVDAMNFRVQLFSLDGTLQSSIGQIGDGVGSMFRPKGIGVDSEGHIYVVDGLWGLIQVFDQQGRLLYYFGGRGANLGEFQLPSGLFIDKNDRIYVVDSFNARVQVFQYFGVTKEEGAKK